MAIRVPAIAGKIIHLGRAGENLATTITFDVADWLQEFGTSGSFTLFVQQGGGEYYVQNLVEDSASELNNNLVEWDVTSSNTTTVGLGKCELMYSLPTEIQKQIVEGYYYNANFYSDENHTNKLNPNALLLYIDLSTSNYYYYNGMQFILTSQGGAGTTQSRIVKSMIFDIVVTNSIDIEAAGEVPTPIQSWLEEVSQLTYQIDHAADYANEAQQWATGGVSGTPSATNNSKYYSEVAEAAVYKVGEMNVEASTGAPGNTADVDITTITDTHGKEIYSLDFTIPRGGVFWTTSVSPSYSNNTYTFTISNLSGPSEITPSIGDTILYDVYWYSISSVSTTKVTSTQRTSIKGDTGEAAGFGTPTASVTNTVGTPSVSVTATGDATAKIFNFAFNNLKGNTGEKGDKGDGFAGVLTTAEFNNLNASTYDSYKNKVYLYNGHAYSPNKNGSSYSWLDGGEVGTNATLYVWSE